MARSKNVDSWIYEQDPEIRIICSALRECIMNIDPSIKEYIRFSSPFYKKNSDLFYISANDSYVTFGFFNTIPIATQNDEFQDTNPVVRHIDIHTLSDIDIAQLKTWITDTVATDIKL